ncbi:hydrolase [Rhizobium sp. S163]|uniref:hydrolase n=1 Tax=Rhizobium sp. S163 TaxID=3055039 RepID=UPI0025A9E0D5|nr:hydrolase [Rhizobium sp. S163]MDM9646366.1 hydrolase [Rhizobium sp. S163]
MSRQNLDILCGPLAGVELISSDVFDTLLIRHPRALRSRVILGEQRFARLLGQRGLSVGVEELLQARLSAERCAYRALNVGGGIGEVRLTEIIGRQLDMLGLPKKLAETRIDIELAIEKMSLFANGALAMALRQQRQAGVRVIALSDTALSVDRLTELIEHFHGPGLIDKVYSSAECGESKRSGRLFSHVLSQEKLCVSRMLHIGDDELADHDVPHSMGIKTIHIPKGRLRLYVSKADGARAEALRRLKRQLRTPNYQMPDLSDKTSFGRNVFGPIVAHFCLMIWLYARQAESQSTALAFCARGGIGIREAFERLISRLSLPLSIRRENLLVSRLIAARVALEARSPAVLDELGREFANNTFAEVAAFVGGRTYDLPPAWNQRFNAASFFGILGTDVGQDLLADVTLQNSLFTRHLDTMFETCERIILCDTGLYGSTQRLLAAGLPNRNFETIQFARCNYKGLTEEHFPSVSGLVVEDNFYNPFKVETVVLRYWHIIESLFEPSVPSARQLWASGNGKIEANCGDIAYGKIDPAAGNLLLSGVLDYIDGVDNGTEILRDAPVAWTRLKQAIINPTPRDVNILGAGYRSIDFGRPESKNILNAAENNSIARQLQSVRSHLWREAAIARDFPRLKSALLPALELAHIMRGLSTRRQR